MKPLKIYLGIVFFILIIAIGLGVYVWYAIQQYHSTISTGKASEVIDVSDTTTVTK